MQLTPAKLTKIVKEELLAESLEVGVLPTMTHILPVIDPPAPGSHEELIDLYYVIDQYSDRLVPDDLQDSCDKDMISMFESFLLSKGLTINCSYYEKIKEEVAPTIKELKEYYGRPRPAETAKSLGISFESDDLDTAQTSSYPSGHTIQACVIAHLLADIHPEYAEDMHMIAGLVGQSRIDRGVHFPTDVEYGEFLAGIIASEILGVLSGK